MVSACTSNEPSHTLPCLRRNGYARADRCAVLYFADLLPWLTDGYMPPQASFFGVDVVDTEPEAMSGVYCVLTSRRHWNE